MSQSHELYSRLQKRTSEIKRGHFQFHEQSKKKKRLIQYFLEPIALVQPKKWQQGVLVNKILVENAQANENRELIFEKNQPSKHSVFSEIAKRKPYEILVWSILRD